MSDGMRRVIEREHWRGDFVARDRGVLGWVVHHKDGPCHLVPWPACFLKEQDAIAFLELIFSVAESTRV